LRRALVNNADIIRDNRADNISDDDWHAVLDVNVTGAFYAVRAVLPIMRRRTYGRILSFAPQGLDPLFHLGAPTPVKPF
jgi:3-oxoacyl-[acyl-carrier protein] reductase